MFQPFYLKVRRCYLKSSIIIVYIIFFFFFVKDTQNSEIFRIIFTERKILRNVAETNSFSNSEKATSKTFIVTYLILTLKSTFLFSKIDGIQFNRVAVKTNSAPTFSTV